MTAIPYYAGDSSYYIQNDPNIKISDSHYLNTLESLKVSSIAYLDSFAEPMKNRGLNVSSAVALGYPPDQIIDFAKENAIDLIAISSHGRTGIRRWVFGSVTDKVLHAADTPVLVIRSAKA